MYFLRGVFASLLKMKMPTRPIRLNRYREALASP
jgi:hypothetical protein